MVMNMTNRLVRNAFCILLLLGLACGITGLYEQRAEIKEEHTPHRFTVEGGR